MGLLLAGRGVPRSGDRGRGDGIVEVVVELPRASTEAIDKCLDAWPSPEDVLHPGRQRYARLVAEHHDKVGEPD